jgi:DNA repair protein RadC
MRPALQPTTATETPPDMTNNDPHYHGHRQRLRARFLKSGLAGFADYEVVELLLTLAIPRSDVKQPAKALIARFGNLRGILDAPIEELRSIPGIGSVTPVALQIIKAAATLYLQQSSEGRDTLADPARLSEFWRMRIGALQNEVFEVAYLDSGYRLLQDGVETLEEGTIDRAAVYPRRVVEAALRRGAAALVLAHNHPNGNVEPSEHDKLLTRAIVLAADTVYLRVVDHFIVSAQETFSFRKAGLL